MLDYTTLTDEEFEKHRQALMQELVRRNELKEAPEEAVKIAKRYEKLGGSTEELIQYILSQPNEAEGCVETPAKDGVEPIE